MTYEEFEAEYEKLLNRMMSYSPNEAGSNIYASKLADLTEKYPEFEDRYDSTH